MTDKKTLDQAILWINNPAWIKRAIAPAIEMVGGMHLDAYSQSPPPVDVSKRLVFLRTRINGVNRVVMFAQQS